MSIEGKVLIIEADSDRGSELSAVLKFIDREPILVDDCNHWKEAIENPSDFIAILIGQCKSDKALEKLLKEIHDFDQYLPIFLLLSLS